jgi:6-phosphogluconate dehydrogenase
MAEQAVADVGLIGLAVMGENLALNIADHGYKVAVYNRTTDVMRKFVARENPPGGLVGTETLRSSSRRSRSREKSSSP